MLALFAGASGDHNPIHIDLDVARSAGLDDVFAHGMLSMAYLGLWLTAGVPQERLRSLAGPLHRDHPRRTASPPATGRVVSVTRRPWPRGAGRHPGRRDGHPGRDAVIDLN